MNTYKAVITFRILALSIMSLALGGNLIITFVNPHDSHMIISTLIITVIIAALYSLFFLLATEPTMRRVDKITVDGNKIKVILINRKEREFLFEDVVSVKMREKKIKLKLKSGRKIVIVLMKRNYDNNDLMKSQLYDNYGEFVKVRSLIEKGCFVNAVYK